MVILLALLLNACSQFSINNQIPEVFILDLNQTTTPTEIRNLIWANQGSIFITTDSSVGLMQYQSRLLQPQSALSLRVANQTYIPFSVTVNEGGNRIAWVSENANILYWEPFRTSEPILIMKSEDMLTGVSIHPTGTEVVYSDTSGRIGRIQTSPDVEVINQWQVPNWLTNITYSKDGTTIASADLTNSILYFFSLDGGLIRTIEQDNPSGFPIYRVLLSPGWKFAAWIGGHVVQVMELETAAITAEFVHGDAVSAVAWSPDESALATSSALTTGNSQSPVVTIWEIESGTSLAQYPQAEPVTSLSWSPDGLQLAILDAQSSIKIIDVP